MFCLGCCNPIGIIVTWTIYRSVCVGKSAPSKSSIRRCYSELAAYDHPEAPVGDEMTI